MDVSNNNITRVATIIKCESVQPQDLDIQLAFDLQPCPSHRSVTIRPLLRRPESHEHRTKALHKIRVGIPHTVENKADPSSCSFERARSGFGHPICGVQKIV